MKLTAATRLAMRIAIVVIAMTIDPRVAIAAIVVCFVEPGDEVYPGARVTATTFVAKPSVGYATGELSTAKRPALPPQRCSMLRQATPPPPPAPADDKTEIPPGTFH